MERDANVAVKRVAVYGTLKRGLSNHGLLSDMHYLGSDSLRSIVLYDLGEYPGAKLEPSNGIYVEIFEVTSAVLVALDILEECDRDVPSAGLYSRVLCPTRFGEAWIYIYNGSVSTISRFSEGSWVAA